MQTHNKNLPILAALLGSIIVILVYYTGGTVRVYAHLIYIPIGVIATTSGVKFGLTSALVFGLAIGPYMPLNVASGTLQSPVNWILRIVVYCAVAVTIGQVSSTSSRRLRTIFANERQRRENTEAMIMALVQLASMRNDETGEHLNRVAAYSRLIAEGLQKNTEYRDRITEHYVDTLEQASELHDIGKIGIPDSVLRKPGRLSDAEFELMKTHTTLGAKTLEKVGKRYPDNELVQMATSLALTHHEKWDGSGYPNGLHGQEIPLSGRIMALTDAYDAMRSERVYKKAFSHDYCVEAITENSGTHYDPDIVAIFLENEHEFNRIYDEFS
ncbi:MAG: HD domain-containing protein [Bacillota bacterium]